MGCLIADVAPGHVEFEQAVRAHLEHGAERLEDPGEIPARKGDLADIFVLRDGLEESFCACGPGSERG